MESSFTCFVSVFIHHIIIYLFTQKNLVNLKKYHLALY